MPQRYAVCSDPRDQAALLLDREERGNACTELKCLGLDHPGEEECNSGPTAEAGLQNAVVWLLRSTPTLPS